MLKIELIIKGYDENEPEKTAKRPQKFSIGSQTTVAYKMNREDIEQDMSDSFYDDLQQTGVYVLFGKTSPNNHDMVYIGQSDNVAKRLYNHKGGQEGEKQNGKTFWTECYAFVSADSQLQRGNAEYLEYVFYQKTYEAGRYIVDNTNVPGEKNISLSDKIFCNNFMLDCDLLSRIMGRPIFDSPKDDIKVISVEKLSINNRDRVGDNNPKFVNATGYTVVTEEFENGFTVLANSIITKDVTPKASKSIRDLRRFLKRHGYIKEEEGKLIFVKEYTFASPGIAASVVLGRSASAKEWKEV